MSRLEDEIRDTLRSEAARLGEVRPLQLPRPPLRMSRGPCRAPPGRAGGAPGRARL
jgi:hypothetical protein